MWCLPTGRADVLDLKRDNTFLDRPMNARLGIFLLFAKAQELACFGSGAIVDN
jgi:hypothetical protein